MYCIIQVDLHTNLTSNKHACTVCTVPFTLYSQIETGRKSFVSQTQLLTVTDIFMDLLKRERPQILFLVLP